MNACSHVWTRYERTDQPPAPMHSDPNNTPPYTYTYRFDRRSTLYYLLASQHSLKACAQFSATSGPKIHIPSATRAQKRHRLNPAQHLAHTHSPDPNPQPTSYNPAKRPNNNATNPLSPWHGKENRKSAFESHAQQERRHPRKFPSPPTFFSLSPRLICCCARKG